MIYLIIGTRSEAVEVRAYQDCGGLNYAATFLNAEDVKAFFYHNTEPAHTVFWRNPHARPSFAGLVDWLLNTGRNVQFASAGFAAMMY